jgi:uncharacterized protein (TIGR03437 family)
MTADFLVVRNAPGLFQQFAGDTAYALALHEDGSLVTPEAPAKSGELLTVYGTGFGPTDRKRLDGLPLPDAPPFLLLDQAELALGEAAFTPQRVFAAPGRTGVDAVEFRLPAGTPPAAVVNLQLTMNGQKSNAVRLPVE